MISIYILPSFHTSFLQKHYAMNHGIAYKHVMEMDMHKVHDIPKQETQKLNYQKAYHNSK